jgi:hypothetical protein
MQLAVQQRHVMRVSIVFYIGLVLPYHALGDCLLSPGDFAPYPTECPVGILVYVDGKIRIKIHVDTSVREATATGLNY